MVTLGVASASSAPPPTPRKNLKAFSSSRPTASSSWYERKQPSCVNFNDDSKFLFVFGCAPLIIFLKSSHLRCFEQFLPFPTERFCFHAKSSSLQKIRSQELLGSPSSGACFCPVYSEYLPKGLWYIYRS